jgi:hypothetical protein
MYESWNCLYQKTGNNVLNLYKKHWPSVWRSRHKKIKKNKKKKERRRRRRKERRKKGGIHEHIHCFILHKFSSEGSWYDKLGI